VQVCPTIRILIAARVSAKRRRFLKSHALKPRDGELNDIVSIMQHYVRVWFSSELYHAEPKSLECFRDVIEATAPALSIVSEFDGKSATVSISTNSGKSVSRFTHLDLTVTYSDFQNRLSVHRWRFQHAPVL
jgi:hypothetical protein